MESVAAEFKNLLVSEVKAFKPTSGVSPRIVEASAEKIADAESKGATFLVGGTGFSSPTTLKPSIVLGVTKDMTLYDEEAFGPSASLFIARDEEHAIEIANDTAYGLSSAVHTTNLHRGLAMAKELVAGQVHINNMTAHDERKFCPHTYTVLVEYSRGLTHYSNPSTRGSQRQWLGPEQCDIRTPAVLRDQDCDVGIEWVRLRLKQNSC